MQLQANETVMFVLRLLGFVSLAVLLVTVVLSQNIHRDTAFFNLVWTYLLYTSFMVFRCVLQAVLPINNY
jgi:hypothetical protein